MIHQRSQVVELDQVIINAKAWPIPAAGLPLRAPPRSRTGQFRSRSTRPRSREMPRQNSRLRRPPYRSPSGSSLRGASERGRLRLHLQARSAPPWTRIRRPKLPSPSAAMSRCHRSRSAHRVGNPRQSSTATLRDQWLPRRPSTNAQPTTTSQIAKRQLEPQRCSANGRARRHPAAHQAAPQPETEHITLLAVQSARLMRAAAHFSRDNVGL